MRLVLATRNRHKLDEVRALLAGWDVDLTLLEEAEAADLVEDGATYAANALKKARAACRLTGLTALGDDSGLEVEALGGAPGLRSRRYAGERATDAENNARLLAALRGLPAERRGAAFVCVLAIVAPDGRWEVVTGRCPVVVAEAPRGQAGFGYDPLGIVPEYGMTFAELPPEVKNKVSHRARAVEALKAHLPAFGIHPR
ncbi:MAG: RdgB/HAM1 family non-canonical purine NTP pyrophosphatase [Deltaproteobacteria bacterium]|nr:RdgB/HAM1 family non-canonical purine NTP pyrophosphatase [Deltaproteobacteria bacterium]